MGEEERLSLSPGCGGKAVLGPCLTLNPQPIPDLNRAHESQPHQAGCLQLLVMDL